MYGAVGQPYIDEELGPDVALVCMARRRSVTHPAPGQRSTIRDVADLAGVSHATVSRYLNGHSYVSPDTGRAIDRAVAETGYVKNNTARALVMRKNFTAALVVREYSDLFFDDPNLSAMAIGANATFSDRGYQMSILIVESDASAARVVELIGGGSVDGALLLAMHIDDPVVTALVKSGTPLVTSSTPLAGSPITSVDTDNVGGATAIARQLAHTGRRHIAVVNGPRDAPVTPLRDQGYQAGLGDLYDPQLVRWTAAWTAEEGRRTLHELLRSRPEIDAVVAASDALAAGAIDAVSASGRTVPSDVAIVGFDDSAWATRTTPQISTVRQNARQTGIRMAEVLLDEIDGIAPRGRHVVLPNEIVWRESAGPQ